MSKIRLLSENVCNKIAAGEVIERSASVVKELVENSLDAGALKISVVIEKAGQKLISVTDNGEGMDEDDAIMCLESHATSKITDENDIFNIRSFGFRGEAIPSIASCSKFSIRTRRRDTSEGVEVIMHGGKLISSTPAGCAPGTEMIVRELFYNVPARRKFVKSQPTEERHIIEAVTAIALAHPEVAFELKLDGRSIISSPASQNPVPRMRELFGREYAENMLPVSKTENGITVSGFVSKRTYTRAGRSEQRVYINGRCVESPAVYKGIREGCGPTLEKGRHLCTILFLSVEPSFVDVNVHPAKREVRFRDDFAVTGAVRSAVTTALRSADPVIPFNNESFESSFSGTDNQSQSNLHATFTADSERVVKFSFAPSSTPEPDANIDATPSTEMVSGIKLQGDFERIMRAALIDYRIVGTPVPTAVYKSSRDEPENFRHLPENANLPTESPENDMMARIMPHEDEKKTAFAGNDLQIIGIMENSYIVGTIKGGLVLIDQHAAHERVLFEKLLRHTDESLAQKLLIPITIELSRAEMRFVSQNINEFTKIGYEIDPFGDNTIKLNAIPYALKQDNAGGVFRDILTRLAETSSASRVKTDIIARAACKAAVKSHDRLSIAECESLVRQMAECELPFSCPHGRPTVLNISLNEVERRFGRK